MKLLQDTTSLKERRINPKRAQYSLKRGLRSSWLDLVIRICLSKKPSPEGVRTFELGTRVIQQKINLRPDTGLVRLGDMKVEEVLKLLEKHEAECTERYQKIDKQLDKLDMRLWGIALLIVATAIAGRLL